MARIFTDGAEFRDTLFWSATSNLTDSGISTSLYRSGSASYARYGNVLRYFRKNITAVSEAYFRIGFMFQSGPTASVDIFSWAASGTMLGNLRLSTMSATQGVLVAYVGSSSVGTGTTVLLANNWYVIEVHIKIADSGGDYEVKLEGVPSLEIDFSGDTKPDANTTFNGLFYGTFVVSQGANVTFVYDDLAMNDISGAADNSWCGDGRVILLSPNGNGDVSQLMGSDADQTDNYLHVDEAASDNDTTYVEGSVVDERDLYNLTPCGLSNVDIKRVFLEARARNTIAAGGKIALVAKTNSTEYDSADLQLLASYSRIAAAEYLLNPNTSSAWSVSDLDSLQAGPKTR